MQLTDLLHPERVLSFAAKVFLAILAFTIVVELLRRISAVSESAELVAFLVMSPIAYLIRERRKARPPRRMAQRGAERTPIRPPNEEQEE